MTNGAMDKTLFGKNLKEIIQDSDLAMVAGPCAWKGKGAGNRQETRTPLIIYKDGKIREYEVLNEDIS